ncbi:LysR family transcriptional regulator [Cysteiniphilum sp. QT6929]|uniref:LysR family transcriptional regulator n=1 Tax=Cysteiniphilum TaxID=2056696 RepID=UPI0024B345C4|nr:LysR family transcriptional regulator [Cysteiniphilum sp. QT6929]WHN65777.1 LysR family transcriptional regulator [Cysteiniphilum sp. QT6929]
MDNEDVQVLRLLLTGAKVTEVGEQINLSQPAVTARINKLRKYFDDPLLVRDGKEMVLTAKALSLSNAITRLHESIQSLYPIEHFDAKNTPSIINLYISDGHYYFCFEEYIDAIYEVSDLHEVRITVFPLESGIEGRYDFQNADIIIGTVYPIKGFTQEIIAWDQYQLVHQVSSLKNTKKITMQQYVKLPHVVFAREDESNPFLEYLSRPDPRNIKLRTNNINVAYPHLAQGRCVATLGESFAKEHGLAYLPLPFFTPEIPIALSYPNFLQIDAKNRWLRNLCAKVIRTKARALNLKLGV